MCLRHSGLGLVVPGALAFGRFTCNERNPQCPVDPEPRPPGEGPGSGKLWGLALCFQEKHRQG